MAMTSPDGPTALSDMHAKWSEKGAHEFVPNMGSANYASRTDRNVRDNRMMAPVAFGQQPMVMQNAWMQGYMPEGQWNMQNQMMPGSSFGNGNLKPRNYTALWNLRTDYTIQDLLTTLNAHDFYPECHDADGGCFLLSFPETWQAAAFAMSFDDTNEILKPAGVAKVRSAIYKHDTQQWSKEDVPQAMQMKVVNVMKMNQ